MDKGILQVGALEQGLQRRAVRGVVEVADHRDIGLALGHQRLVDELDPLGLGQAFFRRGRKAAEAFALEVVDQDDQLLVLLFCRRQRDLELRAIAGKDQLAVGRGVVDMAAQLADGVARGGHQADIDAPCIVAVDQHHMGVQRAAQGADDFRVEVAQGRAAFRLDHRQHIGLQVDHHPRGIAHGFQVHRGLDQLQRTDPLGAAVGDNLQAAGLGPLDQAAAVLPQDHKGALVRLAQAQLGQQLDHLRLVLVGVDGLAQQLVELGETLQHRLAFGPAFQVHGLGAVEQVFNVVGRESHRALPLRGADVNAHYNR